MSLDAFADAKTVERTGVRSTKTSPRMGIRCAMMLVIIDRRIGESLLACDAMRAR